LLRFGVTEQLLECLSAGMIPALQVFVNVFSDNEVPIPLGPPIGRAFLARNGSAAGIGFIGAFAGVENGWGFPSQIAFSLK
jgi:hypothetical protein